MLSPSRVAAALLGVCVVALPVSAFAVCFPGIPCPANSILPPAIALVGFTPAGAGPCLPGPDPVGIFQIAVYDGAPIPALVPGALVEIDFSPCCNDIRVTDAVGPPPKIVSQIAPLGVAVFNITGAAAKLAVTPLSGCAIVRANGVVLTDGASHNLLRVAVYDLDGATPGGMGVGLSDLSAMLGDVFSGQPRMRSDYDFSGALGPADVSKMVTNYFKNCGWANGIAMVCP